MFEKLPKDLENAIGKLSEWKQKILEEDIIEAIKNRVKVLKKC